ncbi:DNA polymerase III subunit beta [Lentzea sp. NPDC042327]|uniref:DNA polymerase III subunit beta n=1 Tax=Lentzea sp. NPDC042327 TaxID=3154801 RepID=UPI0033CD0C67
MIELTAVLNRLETTQVDTDAIVFATTHAELLAGLEAARLGVASKPPVAVLGGVLLEGVDGQLALTTFDGEVHVRVKVATTTCTDGRLLVDHANLLGALDALLTGVTKKKAANMPVEIWASAPDRPVLVFNGQEMPLKSLRIEDYPTPYPALPPVVAQVSRADWVADVERVLVAAGTDIVLPVLTAVYVELGEGAMTMTCTDRFRVATVQTRALLHKVAQPDEPALVPAQTLKDLLKKVKESTENWVLIGRDSENHVMSFSIGNVTLATFLIDSRFPTWRELLPTEQHGHVTVDRDALIEQVKRASKVMKHLPRATGSVALFIKPDAAFARARAWERDEQVKVPALPATVVDCEVSELWFNPKYLLEGLNAFTGKTVSIFPSSAPTRPVLFFDAPADFDTTHAYRYLVMPVRQSATPPTPPS